MDELQATTQQLRKLVRDGMAFQMTEKGLVVSVLDYHVEDLVLTDDELTTLGLAATPAFEQG